MILALSTGASTAQQLAEILDQLGGGLLGANLDPGRLALRDLDAPAAVAKLAGHLVHVHATDGVAGEGLVRPGQGQVDWKELAAALESVSYSGPLILRAEPSPKARDSIEQGLAFLREL